MTEPIITDEEVRYIPLTRGYFAIVDAQDYERIAAQKWCVTEQTAKYRTPYAMRKDRVGDKYVARRMHRVVLGLTGSEHVDHINGNGLDNRRSNLRVCTHSENGRNTWKPMGRGSSQYKGVSYSKRFKKWRARYRMNNKEFWIGSFATEIEAAKAYDAVVSAACGDFCKLNFPNTSKSNACIDRVLTGK